VAREITVCTIHLSGLPVDDALLDEVERERWRRLRTAPLRDTFAAAHWGRRIVLAKELGRDPAGLRFVTGRWGKPELAGHAIFHSFSHSRDVAIIAMSSTHPVGIDIEEVRSELPAVRLAGTFFGPGEARAVERAADQRAHFIRLWTRKEAAGKVTGISLDRTLRIDADVDDGSAGGPVDLEHVDAGAAKAWITDIDAPNGFLAAAAMLGAEPFAVHRSTFSVVPA